ncbi:hypothetical protein EDD85DRAFT_793783 [Armillaria nabsnona]|nr:hypothetical protein EDD85DRAFT_793783 [Armillaria nabsnona]
MVRWIATAARVNRCLHHGRVSSERLEAPVGAAFVARIGISVKVRNLGTLRKCLVLGDRAMEVTEVEETIMDDHVDNQTYVLKLAVHGTDVILQDLEIPRVRVISMDGWVNMLGWRQGRRRGQEVGVVTGWRPSELPKPLDCFVRLSSAPTVPPRLTLSRRKRPRDKVVVESRRVEDQRTERVGTRGPRWMRPVQPVDSWQRVRRSCAGDLMQQYLDKWRGIGTEPVAKGNGNKETKQVCWIWYEAGIRRLLRYIDLNDRWDCIYWSHYLERHSSVHCCIRTLRVDDDYMTMSSFLFNDVLMACLSLNLFLGENINLGDLQTPVWFRDAVEIKLRDCYLCRPGAECLFKYSTMTGITIVRPRFPVLSVHGPVWYGPPHLVRSLTVARITMEDMARLWACLPARMLLFKRVVLDIIPGGPARRQPSRMGNLGERIIGPSLGRAVTHLFLNADAAFPPTYIDLSGLVRLECFVYRTYRDSPFELVRMLETIPTHAPLHQICVGSSYFFHQSWTLVQATLQKISETRTIDVRLLYHALPPKRDILNDPVGRPLITVLFSTYTELVQYLWVFSIQTCPLIANNTNV